MKPVKKTSFIGVGSGLIVGLAIGVITDNIGYCVALGIIFGAIFSPESQNDKDNSN